MEYDFITKLAQWGVETIQEIESNDQWSIDYVKRKGEMEGVYMDLPIAEEIREKIDEYIRIIEEFWMRSTDVSYYAGVKDTFEFLKEIGAL